MGDHANACSCRRVRAYSLEPSEFPDNPEAPGRLMWSKVPSNTNQVVNCKRCPGGGRTSPGFAWSRQSIETLQLTGHKASGLRPALVCHGGRQKGNAVSKQRMAHWIVDAITLAYQAQGVPCPFRLRAHSNEKCSVLLGAGSGTSLTDICRAAGWATPNTFARSIAFVWNRFPPPVFSPQQG